MSQWPPPPDLDSIQELVRTADVEGFLADGAPADEYETEEEQIFASLQHLPTANLTAAHILPILETVWRKAFMLDDTGLAQRRPALSGLADQIARFFGPEAKPQVRGA